MWLEQIDKVVAAIDKFDQWVKQHEFDSTSWRGILDKSPVYRDDNQQFPFDKAFVTRIRCHMHQFTGSTPCDYETQHGASALHQILADGLPDPFIFHAPAIAGEIGFQSTLPEFEDIPVNDDTNSYQERLRRYYQSSTYKVMPDKPTIIEIGGGYGALGHALKGIHPGCHYVIVDLPESLKFSYAWLTMNDYECRLVTDPSTIHIDDDDVDFWLIPADMKAALNTSRFDLAINTLSFTEMKQSIVDDYARFLIQCLKPEGVLFEQNNEYPNHRYSDYLVSTKDVFEQYFDYRTDVSCYSLLGSTRVWTNSKEIDEKITSIPLNWPKDAEYKIALFGAGKTGIMVANQLKPLGIISHFYDNDPIKWGSRMEGIEIRNPEQVEQDLVDNPKLNIVITSYFYHEVWHQFESLSDRLMFIQQLDRIGMR